MIKFREFKKGDLVLARNSPDEYWRVRFFVRLHEFPEFADRRYGCTDCLRIGNKRKSNYVDEFFETIKVFK